MFFHSFLHKDYLSLYENSVLLSLLSFFFSLSLIVYEEEVKHTASVLYRGIIYVITKGILLSLFHSKRKFI
jgi:hypothetical protein